MSFYLGYRSAILALGNHKNNPKALKIAEERMPRSPPFFPMEEKFHYSSNTLKVKRLNVTR